MRKNKPSEKRKMIIYDLTVSDYKAILEQIDKLGIKTHIEVVDQKTGLGVYAQYFTKDKHLQKSEISQPTPYKQKSYEEELKLCQSFNKNKRTKWPNHVG